MPPRLCILLFLLRDFVQADVNVVTNVGQSSMQFNFNGPSSAGYISPYYRESTLGQRCTIPSGFTGTCTRVSGCHSKETLTTCPGTDNRQLIVCCPKRDMAVPGDVPAIIPEPSIIVRAQPRLAVADLDRLVEQGTGRMIAMGDDASERMKEEGFIIPPGSKTPAGLHLSFFRPTGTSREISRSSLAFASTLLSIIEEESLDDPDAIQALQLINVRNTTLGAACGPMLTLCNCSTKFRTADGSCNNLRNPSWGQSNTRFQRLMPPDYADRVLTSRVSSDGSPLPSPRLVSTVVTADFDKPHLELTLMVMQWGQFIDHDMTLSPIITEDDGMGIQCCSNGKLIEDYRRHPACLAIDIPKNDSFYSRFKESCMEFVRSSFALPRGACNLGYTEQLNALTSFIDGSMVYGNTEEDADALRAKTKGLLLVEPNMFGRSDFLPPSVTESDSCTNFTTRTYCFRSGDVRVNEQIDLTVLHTLWMREHNRIAKLLGQLNPRWNDERIYQEARRIVGAELQHITYKEWLPIILGDRVLRRHGLAIPSYDYGPRYDDTVNPSITNEFSSAAFRFGHSLIQGIIQMQSPDFNTIGQLILHRQFNNPFIVRRHGAMEVLTMGLIGQPPQKFDSWFTSSIRNRLFQNENAFGLDLVSLNLQRGRDHGIPGYNAFRELCGLKRARAFTDFTDTMYQPEIGRLSSVYRSVDDVDLFMGGILEIPVKGGVVGPTFACIIGDMFAKLRRGDRFFYDTPSQTGSFGLDQVNAIKKTSLARIICDNLDYDIRVQREAFKVRSRRNFPRLCSLNKEVPKLDLSPWKEERGGFEGLRFSGNHGGYRMDQRGLKCAPENQSRRPSPRQPWFFTDDVPAWMIQQIANKK